jgi:probable phosphoglycerate mutase
MQGGQAMGGEVALIRHAETAWSREGRHTGRTDVPLTERGRESAAELPTRLAGWRFALVLTSPLARARETCELAGLGAQAEVQEDLLEWDYGEYEGLTSAQIERLRPDWSLWRDGCPGGERASDVAARADRVIARLADAAGPVAVFSHGHLLRVLGARWAALEGRQGARLGLFTAAICVLGHEHGLPIIVRWNDTCGSHEAQTAAAAED